MAVAYAPFEETPRPPPNVPNIKKVNIPVSDNTECNYIVMFFVAGVFLLSLADSMRSK
jgi:hypothetical protein